jgi:16S rRNA U516 pseudouridylate synthase RsuA-like enzyme
MLKINRKTLKQKTQKLQKEYAVTPSKDPDNHVHQRMRRGVSQSDK